MKKNNLFLNILICFFALVFVVSAGAFSYTLIKSKNESNTFDSLAKLHDEALTDAKEASAEDAEGEPETPQYVDRFISLRRENADFCFWLTVPGTLVNYPVMNNVDDSEYYLHKDFYKNKSYSGTPFLGEDCNVDSTSYIVYGHNMKSGKMFGQLDNYKSESFWQENQDVIVGTDTEDRVYKIFGAYETRISDSEFKYYDYTGDISEDQFNELVDTIKKRTPYDTGYTPAYGDQIIMLSTCSYQASNGRYVVAAYLHRDNKS